MTLHPDAQAIVQALQESGFRPFSDFSPEEARERLAALNRDAAAALPEGFLPEMAEVADIDVPTANGAVPVRRYRAASAAPIGTIVFYHGGGWTLGTLDDYDVTCRLLAEATGCAVVSVDYRKAPEHPFPAALDDSVAVLRWVAEQPDSGPLVTCGDSAGGQLATVAALVARDEGGPDIALQILIYPITDHDFTTESYVRWAEGLIVTSKDMQWYWDLYAPAGTDRSDERLSPLRAKDLSGLPPAVVVLGECDVLHDEGIAYVERLRESGVEVELHEAAGMPHVFFTIHGGLKAADDAMDFVAEAVRRRLTEGR